VEIVQMGVPIISTGESHKVTRRPIFRVNFVLSSPGILYVLSLVS
jgi:hypothetical protein